MRHPRKSSALLPVLLLLLICLGGCPARHGPTLPPPPVVPEPQADDPAGQIWQRYVSRTNAAEVMSGPFRINANLRYTEADGKNTRVSALLWGNGQADAPHPLRLDLLAGVGTVVAKVHEDQRSFTAYVPDQGKAFVHDGSAKTLASFGVPIPLTLSDLTVLLTGRSGVLFIPPNDSGVPAGHRLTGAGARYAVPGARLAGEVELSEAGAPMFWSEPGGNGWSMDIEADEINPLLPTKLRISHPKGYSALITVREIARVSPPYSAAQMGLALPPGTSREALAD